MPTTRPSILAYDSTIDKLLNTARMAEEANFESVWVPEFYDRSAVVPLAAMACVTERIGLGSGIAYGFGRTPLVMAAEARDLDALSNGRLHLGLGVGTKRMQQDWHGLDGEHPAPKVEELVALLRQLWRLHEGPVKHEGRFYRVAVQPTAEPMMPFRVDIPVYLAGFNPRMVEAAGAVADGLMGHPIFTERYVREVVRPALARGAARTGRDVEIPITGYVICAVDEDRDAARRAAAAQIAFYATVKTYDRIHELHGFEDEAARVRQAWRAGDPVATIDAVSDEMIDTMSCAGTPSEVRTQMATFAEMYDRVILYPPTMAGEPNVKLLIDTFRDGF